VELVKEETETGNVEAEKRNCDLLKLEWRPAVVEDVLEDGDIVP
jgi:hypothetical protein